MLAYRLHFDEHDQDVSGGSRTEPIIEQNALAALCGRASEEARMSQPKSTSPSEVEQLYTRPELREQIQEELFAGDRGGPPGEWSAQKAQLLALEYERRGGGYRTEGQGPGARNLDHWTEQAWQVRERATRTEKRGDPGRFSQADWDRMGDALADARYRPDHPLGHQADPRQKSLVESTRDELYLIAKELEIPGRSKMRKQDLLEAITRHTDNLSSEAS
jgi:hypothetical protein